jgi:hypothetical protein
MIFNMDCHAPVGRIQRRSPAHRPAPKNTTVLEAEIPVQPGPMGMMLLDHEHKDG